MPEASERKNTTALSRSMSTPVASRSTVQAMKQRSPELRIGPSSSAPPLAVHLKA